MGDGDAVEELVSVFVGVEVGAKVVGFVLGDGVGKADGAEVVGFLLGANVGDPEGWGVGEVVGLIVGDADGAGVGDTVGSSVGLVVGAFVHVPLKFWRGRNERYMNFHVCETRIIKSHTGLGISSSVQKE